MRRSPSFTECLACMVVAIAVGVVNVVNLVVGPSLLPSVVLLVVSVAVLAWALGLPFRQRRAYKFDGAA